MGNIRRVFRGGVHGYDGRLGKGAGAARGAKGSRSCHQLSMLLCAEDGRRGELKTRQRFRKERDGEAGKALTKVMCR